MTGVLIKRGNFGLRHRPAHRENSPPHFQVFVYVVPSGLKFVSLLFFSTSTQLAPSQFRSLFRHKWILDLSLSPPAPAHTETTTCSWALFWQHVLCAFLMHNIIQYCSCLMVSPMPPQHGSVGRAATPALPTGPSQPRRRQRAPAGGEQPSTMDRGCT